MNPKFSLIPANKKIWNQSEFIDFLVCNQGRAIDLDTSSEGPCLESCGVYKLLEQFGYTDVQILTANPLEKHSQFTFIENSPFIFFEADPKDYSTYHSWNKSNIFGCFYNRPLWHRIGLAATLQKNYSKVSTINIRCNPKDFDQRELFEVYELFANHPESFKNFSEVFDTWPIKLEPIDCYTVHNNTTGHTDQLAQFYTNFLIDMVGETWISGNTFYITEKTVRPMLMKKPFILMGARSSLLYLRQMGFKTFWEFWDEDYDGYSEADRFDKIINLVDQLSKLSINELEKIYNSMQPILEHNYKLLQTRSYQTKLEQVK